MKKTKKISLQHLWSFFELLSKRIDFLDQENKTMVTDYKLEQIYNALHTEIKFSEERIGSRVTQKLMGDLTDFLNKKIEEIFIKKARKLSIKQFAEIKRKIKEEDNRYRPKF